MRSAPEEDGDGVHPSTDSDGEAVTEARTAFARTAPATLASDSRIVGVAAGGSFTTGGMDEFSDLDLVIAVEPSAWPDLLDDRKPIAGSLGPLLAAFTGEHVGEPRLLICLYGPPLLHVDLKFVSLEDVHDRVEDPAVLWERGGRLTSALEASEATYPAPDREWIEERFWIWIHYLAGKIGRGEILEAVGSLAFLRSRVLGPLAQERAGTRPDGLRRIEVAAPELADRLHATVAAPDAASCLRALNATVDLYRELRRDPRASGSPERSSSPVESGTHDESRPVGSAGNDGSSPVERAVMRYVRDLALVLPAQHVPIVQE